MNRPLSTSFFRSISTSVKNTRSVVAAETQKDSYYKNLNENFNENDVKPEDWDEALPYSAIPGPKPAPIVGNIWRFLPFIGELHNVDVLDMHRRFRDQYGNIAVLKGIPTVKDTVLLFSPEDFELVHRNEGVFPIRDALIAFGHYRNVVRKDLFQGVGGVTTVHGMDWYNIRSKVNPILMQPRAAQQYVASMDHIANDFLDRIKHFAASNPEGEMPEDFLNQINRWALESVGYIALDRRLGCLDPNLKPDSEPQTIISSAVTMFYLYYKVEVIPSLWKVYPTKTWKEFVAVLDTMTFIFLKYINEAIEKLDSEKTHRKEHELSVFERLLNIDKKIATAMAMDMLTAGVDTTGRTTGAALYYLAKNPRVQDKLREEMLTQLPKKNSPVTKEVLATSPYLKAVIKETTRMAPIAVGNFRQAVKDMVIRGYQIPKGTNVLTSNLLLCHSEEHFPRPQEFIPERWLRETTGELSHKNTHPFVHLPFGFGPRSCIGKRLANLELEVILAKVIRNFNIDWRHEDMTFNSFPLYGIAKPLKLHLKELDS